MIAPRGVWQLCLRPSIAVLPRSASLRRGGLLFALGFCFFAAADLRITAVARASWLVAGTKYNLLDSGRGLRCCRVFAAPADSLATRAA